MSCNSHVISSILHPWLDHHVTNSSHLLAFLNLTLSYTNGNPDQPCFPLSGPNIGCVHNTSHSSGSNAIMVVFAWHFTDNTSTINTSYKKVIQKKTNVLSKCSWIFVVGIFLKRLVVLFWVFSFEMLWFIENDKLIRGNEFWWKIIFYDNYKSSIVTQILLHFQLFNF